MWHRSACTSTTDGLSRRSRAGRRWLPVPLVAGMLALGISTPASAAGPSLATPRATATSATTVDLHLDYADAFDFHIAGPVVHGGFTLGRTTAIGSGEYTTTDGYLCYFLLSLHRSSPAAQGTGLLSFYCTANGSSAIVLPFQFRAQWNGSTLTGAAVNAIYLVFSGGRILPYPTSLDLTVNIGA